MKTQRIRMFPNPARLHSQFSALLLALSVSACTTLPPGPLAGNNFAPITPHLAQSQPDTLGKSVRWGGTIASIDNTEKNETCFQIVSRPLDAEARPEDSDHTNGRFIACASGFYDPEIYRPAREITFTGTVQTPTFGKVGKSDYIFPRLAVDTLFLWPKRQPVPDYPMGFYGPGFDPWMMTPGFYPWMY